MEKKISARSMYPLRYAAARKENKRKEKKKTKQNKKLWGKLKLGSDLKPRVLFHV